MRKIVNALIVSAALIGAGMAFPASADDAAYNAALQDIEQTLGFVPTFMRQMPKAGCAGAWQQLKGLEFSEDTALDAKTKALIELAVVSQIPCQYCIWADAAAAKAAGATDEEIAEAVTMAALTRHWSTFFHGMQVDFEQFKMELGGEMAAQ